MEIDNLTPRAKELLALAHKEADHMKHTYVGTEHVLIGLVAMGEDAGVNILWRYALDLETVRAEVAGIDGLGPGHNLAQISYTPRLKRVLALAAKQAEALRKTHVGPEHILLGLLEEGRGVGTRVLKKLDVNLTETRKEIMRELDPNFGKE